MLQMLPLIAGLLEGNKKEADQRKQNQINAYMGEAPSAQPQQGGGMLSGLAGMLQGIGGAKNDPSDIKNVVADRYKGDGAGTGPSNGPLHDPLSTEANMGSLSIPSYQGARDYDEDDRL
jgi:hypothetical protein